MRTSIEIALVVVLTLIGGWFLLDGGVAILNPDPLVHIVGVSKMTLSAIALGAVAIVNAIHRSKER